MYSQRYSKTAEYFEYLLARECYLAFKSLRNALKELEFEIRAGFNPDQPRIPAGNPDGGQWTDGGNLTGVRVSDNGNVSGAGIAERFHAISEKYNWARPVEFKRHYDNHKKDFGSRSPADYARKANEFYKTSLDKDLPRLITKDGYIKIYDPKTKAFGVYGPEGKTETFMKPRGGNRYFVKEIRKVINNGGRFINSRGGRGTGFIDPKTPFEYFPDDDLLR